MCPADDKSAGHSVYIYARKERSTRLAFFKIKQAHFFEKTFYEI